jgi:hypothetical protein
MKSALPIIDNGRFRRLGHQIEEIPHIILNIENDISNLLRIRTQKIQMQNNIITKLNKAAERIAQNSIYGSGRFIVNYNKLNIISLIECDILSLELSRLNNLIK